MPWSTAPCERLLPLDVFSRGHGRAMPLVNNPGTWSASYAPLQHAPWHGWTPTSSFPSILFLAGIATHLSPADRRARGASDRSR